MSTAPASPASPSLLYCHCQYAQIVPHEVKAAVLQKLCESQLPFEAVPDLCELAARRDPSLRRLASAGSIKIAACFPRAVKWLFASAHAPLPHDSTEVLNMRTLPAHDVATAFLNPQLSPNLPPDKPSPADAPKPASSESPSPTSNPIR